MQASDEMGDLASSGGLSTCAGIARTGAAAAQTAEPERHNRGISHVWISCMRITSDPALSPEEESTLQSLSVNRISLPIPKLRHQVFQFPAGQAEDKVRQETPPVTADLLVQPPRFHAVKRGEIGIKQHTLAP